MYLVFMEVSLHGDMMYVRKCTMFDVRRVLLLYRDSLAQELSYSAANTPHTHTHTHYTHMCLQTHATCRHACIAAQTHTHSHGRLPSSCHHSAVPFKMCLVSCSSLDVKLHWVWTTCPTRTSSIETWRLETSF